MLKNIVEKIKKANYIYIAGNGGSASSANHFANDLVKIAHVKAISLCANEAIITAYGNDSGYENIFSDQLKVFLQPNDLLITISGSGTSSNIVNAIKLAKKKGSDIFSFPTMKEKNCNMFEIENIHLKLLHQVTDKLCKK